MITQHEYRGSLRDHIADVLPAAVKVVEAVELARLFYQRIERRSRDHNAMRGRPLFVVPDPHARSQRLSNCLGDGSLVQSYERAQIVTTEAKGSGWVGGALEDDVNSRIRPMCRGTKERAQNGLSDRLEVVGLGERIRRESRPGGSTTRADDEISLQPVHDASDGDLSGPLEELGETFRHGSRLLFRDLSRIE